MSDAVIITGMICCTLIALFFIWLAMNYFEFKTELLRVQRQGMIMQANAPSGKGE